MAFPKENLLRTRLRKKYLAFGFNLLESLDRFYEEAKPAFKLQTISSMYAEKLIFENNSYRTPSTERNLPYYSMPAEATAKIKKDKINKIDFVLAGHLRRSFGDRCSPGRTNIELGGVVFQGVV